MKSKPSVSEILHHMGEDSLPLNAVSPPIFQTSIFCFESFEKFQEALADESSHFLYSRGNNPTVNLCESKLAALEHADSAKLVSSGSAAIALSILAFVKKGDHVVMVEDAYSWTRYMVTDYLSRFGVEHTFVEGKDPRDFERAIRPNTTLFYLESPTTLTFKLQDLRAVARIAKAHGIKTVIDNTWATPIFQNPIDLGIDVVVHSASKYIGGNSDLVAGVIAGSKEDINHIFNTEFLPLGPAPDPFMAWLIMRNLRTLHIRMPVHFENAKKVCRFLQDSPKVQSVLYPFAAGYDQADLAVSQMRGGSGLFSFMLKTRSRDYVKLFVNSLHLFKRAVSWGGYESLVFPAAVKFADDQEIPAGKLPLIRLHIGLEDADELISDLKQALEKIS
jgi:cystathionine beta-lyase/cystathionine gamma-synthase